MARHRLAPPLRISPPLTTDPPFSNFDFVDEHFGAVPAIRRILSQVRSYGCRAVVIEDIPAIGVLKADDEELSDLFADFEPSAPKRLQQFRRQYIQFVTSVSNGGERRIEYTVPRIPN